jgi:hypothetical protein
MRRVILFVACLSAGCSNAPIAGFLDCVSPARGKGDREPVVPRIRPPGTTTPPAAGDVLPPPANVPPVTPQ